MTLQQISLSFVLLVLGLYALVLLFMRRGARVSVGAMLLAALAMCVWLGVTGVLAGSGVLVQDVTAMPPLLMRYVMLPALVTVFTLTALPATGRLLDRAPQDWLVSFQAFRIPMELILFGLASVGELHTRLTFSGLNFDIVTGALALPVGYLMHKQRAPRGLVIGFNILGLLLLFTIVAMAAGSMPTPMRIFHDEPATRVAFHVPFVWLPGFVVPLALLGHLLSLRAALRGPVP